VKLTRREALGATVAVAASVGTPAASRRDKPKSGFLWGVATAGHQIEGNNVNSDHWVMEHVAGTYFKEKSGDACDSWNRWPEDLALIKSAGLNSYRFSVEWARIEPESGEFSQAALDHYRRMCVACRANGIEPIVTFHHFTSPRWVAGMGGWESSAVVDHFARYVERTSLALRGTVDWFCTMNEPNAQVTSKVLQKKPWDIEPRLRADAARMVGSDKFHMYFLGDSYKVRDVCLAAHAKGREAIKSVIPGAKVGLTLALQQLSAATGGDALYRKMFAEARAPFYEAASRDDFIGVQTYYKFELGPDGYLPAPTGGMKDMVGLPTPPGALAASVREAWEHAKVPVLVSEHGHNSNDDAQRIQHLRGSMDGLGGEIARGTPVLGYLHWSLLDNFEWSSGYVPRFGLVAVDRETFVRAPKPSLKAYQNLVTQTRRSHRWA
jgi:beta-glucosidase